MALHDCIRKLKDVHKLSDSQAKKVSEEADRLENIYSNDKTIPSDQVRTRAEQDALHYFQKKIKEDAYATVTQLKKIKETSAEIATHPKSKTLGVRALLRHDRSGRFEQTNASIESLGDAIYTQATAKMADFVEEMRSKIPGGIDTFFRSRQEALRQVVRARFGAKDVDLKYQQFSDLFGEAVDSMLSRMRKAGAPINKLKDWGMPQRWNQLSLQKAGKDNFVNDTFRNIDRTKMTDSTGRGLTDNEIKELIGEVFDTISTDGLNRAVKTQKAFRGAGSGITRRNASRVLHFKDADAWLEMFDKYGDEEIYDMMMEYLQGLAQDVALVERLGPNPTKTFKLLNQEAELEAKIENRSINGIEANENIFKDITGMSSGIANPRMANILGGLRNIQTSSKLGSASISALADQAYMKHQAKLLGLSYGRMLTRVVKHILTLDKATKRKEATQLGVIANWAHGMASAASRFTDVTTTGKFSRITGRMADFTIRASGLSAITRISKMAFHMEFSGFLARNRMTKLSQLSKEMQTAFRLHGITETDWNKIRKSITKIDNAEFIDIEKLGKQDIQLASKYQAMIISEQRIAVPEPDAEIRAITTRGQPRGSISRELMSGFMQFKSFPFTVMFQQMQRTLFHPILQNKMNRFKYAAGLAVMTTLIGGLAVQLKQLKAGKEPWNTEDPEFWIQAAAQGGAAGFVGDIFLDTEIRPESRLARMAGPVANMALEALAMTGHIPDVITGKSDLEDVHAGRRIHNFLQKATPGSNIWYSQLVMERYIMNMLQRVADPKAAQAWKRQERRLKKRTGQRYWWRKGKTSPQ